MIPLRRIFITLILVEIALVVIYLIPLGWWTAFLPENWCKPIMDRFDLDQEANLPTWYSTVLLFSISLISLLIHLFGREEWSSKGWPSFWLIFSAVYCFLSLDETARLHETITFAVHIKWTLIYAPFAGFFFLWCAYYLLRINKNIILSRWMLGGMIIYASGALLAEVFNYFIDFGIYEVAFEEGMEMLGEIIVLTGLIRELNRLLEIPVNPQNLK